MASVDQRVLDWIVAHRTGWATSVADLVMNLGSNALPVSIIVLISAAYVVVRRKWTMAVVTVTAGVVSYVTATWLKDVIGRPRPPAPSALVAAAGYSMPSSDGALTAGVFLAVFLSGGWASRRSIIVAGALLLIALIIVGICLVYLAAHWFTDVIAGWALGALVAVVCVLAARWLLRRLPGGVESGR